eukprot:5275137-Pyramimonas_sp.AAC.1
MRAVLNNKALVVGVLVCIISGCPWIRLWRPRGRGWTRPEKLDRAVGWVQGPTLKLSGWLAQRCLSGARGR